MAESSNSVTVRELSRASRAPYRFVLFGTARPPKAPVKENVMSVFIISVATSFGSTGLFLGLRLHVMRLARLSEVRRQTV
jgi:hypothetical protein